ncbi:hypothetical protein D9615_004907 [Tricholomella constricta]|uniref:DUF7330 domain-containing protein n=1 Tax=Tricholomella constricta TaxID=117010 RepID=A0A8H5HH67_9AGAR|nr:hypothetical protein D9615_004907 [Tricholomella constricta]
MIIVPTDDDNKRAQPLTTIIEVPADDPPPTYTTEPPPVPVAEPSVAPAPPKQPAVKPSNYVSISRSNGSVKGVWVLDPFLTIPASLLPPLSPEEVGGARKHFSLKANNGVIDADITLASYEPTQDSKQSQSDCRRATIFAKAHNGGVTTKLHTPSEPRIPFYLNILAFNGSVNVHLPRSFHGLVVVKAWNGNTKFSSESSVHLTTFSDVDKTRRCFIGDYSEMTDEWQGDEVFIEARNGSVKLQYDDEAQEKGDRKSGFFGRLFGF